jgi:hypothetical protein
LRIDALPASQSADSLNDSDAPFRILLALSDTVFAGRFEAICRSRYWLVVEPTPARAIAQMGLVQFSVVAVDYAAPFNAWENVLRAAAQDCPHAGRLLLFGDDTARPLPPISPWLYHQTLDKRADPQLVRRRLDALSAGTEALRNTEERD